MGAVLTVAVLLAVAMRRPAASTAATGAGPSADAGAPSGRSVGSAAPGGTPAGDAPDGYRAPAPHLTDLGARKRPSLRYARPSDVAYGAGRSVAIGAPVDRTGALAPRRAPSGVAPGGCGNCRGCGGGCA